MTKPLLPHTEEWLAKQRAEEAAATERNAGLEIAQERVKRDGRVPKWYCVRCGERDPQYNQLCGFASWHIPRPWPEDA